MLNISQFAKECGTTVKTIRHYDNIGLLRADYISEESGYRYYRRVSAIKYRQIVKLKQSGFTLKEIKENFSDYNIDGNLTHIEQKILLLKKQQELCKNMKKEYERIMAESKKVIVSTISEKISIASRDGGKPIIFTANPGIVSECAKLLDRSLNEEQFIVIDIDDLRQAITDKTAFSMGSCYSPDFDISDFDNIDISRNDEKASTMIVFFEASPDVSPEKISEAIGAFLMSFSEDVNILFSANLEHGEKGLNLQWICLK